MYAEATVWGDVWMVNFSNEVDFRRAECIVIRKMYVEEENSVFVGSTLGADHCSLPVKIISLRLPSTDILYRILDQLLEFLLYPPFSHYVIILSIP